MLINKSIRILHLSDIHVGEIKDIGFKHAFTYLNDISIFPEAIYNTMKKNNLIDPHKEVNENLFLVISGDLVCDGTESTDYEHCFEAIDALRQKIKIPKSAVYIIPGNHDMVRDIQDPLVHFKSAYNEFYKNDVPEFMLNKDFGKNTFKKTKWVYKCETNKVAFIPLYSIYPEAKKLPKDLLELISKPNDKKMWLFDRGLITKEQMREVERELDDKETELKDYLKIAVFHHNPMPIQRNIRMVDDYKFPEMCHLANGPEVLATLKRKGISIALHGHAHKNSIHYTHEDYKGIRLVSLGAPSLGCSYNGGDNGDDIPWRPENEGLGFNHLTLNISPETLEIKLDRFIETYSDGISDFTKSESSGTLSLGLSGVTQSSYHTDPFLSFDDGLLEFGQQILKAKQYIFLLNYSEDPVWKDFFTEFWLPVTKDNNIFNAYADIMGIQPEQEKNAKEELLNAIENGYYTKQLINRINSDDGHTLERIRGEETPDDKFSKYIDEKIREIQKRNIREWNYLIELLRCALDSNFRLKKCVYLKPPIDNTTPPRSKFKWMLQSILSARHLNNFDLAWIPFAIRNYEGQSLVAAAMSSEPVYRTNILVGYAERDNNRSVLYLHHNPDRTQIGGRLYRSLGALMQKVILPLSERLMSDFPIYLNGTLYINNIRKLAFLYDCEDIWQEYENELTSAFSIEEEKEEKCERDDLKDVNKIENLFNWVAIPPISDIAIPWKTEDYDYIKEKVPILQA